MLKIVIPGEEYYDEEKNKILRVGDTELHLEHSLDSLSKWETKWEKPFLQESDEKTPEMILDYIREMTLNDVPSSAYLRLTDENINEINEYINAKRTATWFTENDKIGGRRHGSEIITSELIYYWLVALTIPFEVEKWHLNRLLTLVKICNIKNQPDKKANPKTAAASRQALNRSRRLKHGTKG